MKNVYLKINLLLLSKKKKKKRNRKNTQLPIEVWKLIFTYLRLNDLIEISCVCKDFYQLQNLINQRKYLKADLGLFMSTDKYLDNSILTFLMN